MFRHLIAVPLWIQARGCLWFAVAALLAAHGSVQAATITWRGTTDGAWNTTTANWAGGASVFTAGDTVTFDDTATGTTGITTAAAVAPAGTMTINNATKDYSFSGAGGLSGTLNLSKLGAGALNFSNSNTFTGTLTLRGGTTTLSGNAVLTATTGSASGQSFIVGTTAGDNATLVIKDNAAFTTSIVYLGSAASTTGAVLMQGGTFTSTPNGNGSAFFRIGSSGTGIWNQTGGLANIGNTLPTIGRNVGSVGQMTVSSGTFRLTGTTGSDYLQLAGAGNGTLTISGNGVVETGTGSGGGLWFNVVGGGGQTTGTGTLNLDGGTLRTRRVLTSGSVAATSTFNFNGGTLVALTSNTTFMQGLTAANVKAGGALINTNGFNITIAQNLLDGTGGGGLTKSGSGTLTLSGLNTYTGTTAISGGVLSAGNANALGGGNITLTGGTLQYTAASAGQDWSTRFKNSTSAIVLDTNGQNVTLAGVIDSSNTGGLIKIGSGTLALSAANTLTGAVQFNGGSVAFSGGLSPSDFRIGEAAADSGVMTMTGGTLSPTGFFRVGSNGTGTLNQSGGLITFTAAQQLPSIGRLVGSVGQMTISSGTFQLTGNPATAQALQVGASGTGTLTISGNGVVDTGTASIGNGLLVVGQNAGTGAGIVNLDGGTLRTGRIGTTGTAAATSTFNFNGGTVVALKSNAAFMRGLTNTYVKASGAVIDTNGNDISIAQALLDGAGGGGLTKNGAGALTLTAANTFTGSTAVNGGSLVVNGSLAGGVAVAAGSTLAGSGSVGAISGAGSVEPGNSPGILTATSVDPSSNMSFAFELTGAAPAYGSPTNSVNDLLWLTGGTPFTTSLTSANTVSLYLTPAAAEAGTVTGGFFTAGQVDFLTSIQGAAFSYFVQDPNGTFPYGGQNYKTLAQYDPAKSVTISTVAANGGQVMQMVVVPEPGALVLAGVGMAIAAWMARRRQA
jgi:autotransporter-associated beta strand protein/T5SS/PEP-CTERM-associated repeat protein